MEIESSDMDLDVIAHLQGGHKYSPTIFGPGVILKSQFEDTISDDCQDGALSDDCQDDTLYKKRTTTLSDNSTDMLFQKDFFADQHVVSTPLFEVISVTVSHKGQGALAIYGRIWVTNDFGHSINVYNRSVHDPEIIGVEEKGPFILQLSGPSDDLIIMPSTALTVHLMLFDQFNKNVAVVTDQLTFDYTNDCDYTEQKKKAWVCNLYLVEVCCVTFPFAVAATVEALYFSNKHPKVVAKANNDDDVHFDFDVDRDDYDDEDEVSWFGEWDTNTDYGDTDGSDGDHSLAAGVYGEVVALVDNHFPAPLSRNKHFSIKLLKQSVDQPLKVKSGTFIGLSRSVLAVPAYSLLKIKVDLLDDVGSQLAAGTAEFLPQDHFAYKRDIFGENGFIRIRVKWRDYQQVFLNRDFKLAIEEVAISSPLRKKKIDGSSLQLPSPASISCWSQPSVLPKGTTSLFDKGPTLFDSGYEILEVFSVVIFKHNDHEQLLVHGEIKVDDWRAVSIFKRRKDNPLICSSSGTIVPIAGPLRGFSAQDEVGIYVMLKDVEDGMFINGVAGWYEMPLTNWYDRRICSVIRGDRGFVAVHYTIFKYGIFAKVEVLLCGQYQNVSSLAVCGEIVARYGGLSYPTQHERRLYQSVLFQKKRGDSEVVLPSPEGAKLELLKPVVGLPRMASIILQVDLVAIPAVGDKLQGTERLKGEVEFSFSGGKNSLKWIKGRNYSMQINVEFVL